MMVEGFIDEEWSRLQRFLRHWRSMNRSRPGDYPLELDPADWDEQFFLFQEEEE